MAELSAAERRVKLASELSRRARRGMIPAEEVVAVLNGAGVEFVLVGAHGIAAWTKKPRATVDVDVLVAARHHRKAATAIARAFPLLERRDAEVVTRYSEPGSGDVLVDLMKPSVPLLERILQRAVPLDLGGQVVRIPDLEGAVAMKFAAMVGIRRQRTDKMQDAVDFARMVEVNPHLDLDRLSELGALVYPGGDVEVLGLVDAVRRGERLSF